MLLQRRLVSGVYLRRCAEAVANRTPLEPLSPFETLDEERDVTVLSGAPLARPVFDDRSGWWARFPGAGVQINGSVRLTMRAASGSETIRAFRSAPAVPSGTRSFDEPFLTWWMTAVAPPRQTTQVLLRSASPVAKVEIRCEGKSFFREEARIRSDKT